MMTSYNVLLLRSYAANCRCDSARVYHARWHFAIRMQLFCSDSTAIRCGTESTYLLKQTPYALYHALLTVVLVLPRTL
jgi:hypothetical protein